MALRAPWTPDPNLVLIVPAGKGAYQQAWRFKCYHCQNRRTFAATQWIAFYSNGEIDTLAEIDGPPEDDVVMADRPELAELSLHTAENNGNPSEPHTLVRLKGVRRFGPVKNNAASHANRGVAWVQNQRYTDITSLRAARFTSDLGTVRDVP